MADKQISALPEATEITTSDLFVAQQNNQAKKVTGQTLVGALAEALDGHGGISSVVLTSTVGRAKTYTITYADESESYFTVEDGEQGLQGLQTYVHIRYSATYPVTNMLTQPNKYIGVYTGTLSTAPSNTAQYTWYEWKGATGDTGVSITSITKTSSSGNTDTYTISFSNNTTQTFTVTNGANISSISKTGSSGLIDTYTVSLTNGTSTSFNVINGKGIASIELTSGNHSAGTSDTYLITFNDGDTFSFPVYNGANGEGAVSTVSGIPVVGDAGDVPALVIQSSAPTTSTTGYVNQLLFDTTGGVLYVCTAISGNTYTWRGAAVTVDSSMSSSSTNPVQNKVIYTALTGKVGTSTTVNGKALSSNITLAASDVGAVPITRTVNGSALSNDIVTRLIFTNVSIAANAWASDSTYADYDYKAVISTANVTASMLPEVVFDPDDASSGNFAPVAVSGSGSVTIYAKEVPSAAITIPSIICFV